MQEIIINQHINVVFELIGLPYEWEVNPFNGADFVCLLAVNDSEINNEVQDYISCKLVEYGCRYAVCTGHNCSTWDDSIDLEYLKVHDYQVDDSNFIMTSWHTDAPIEDVVHFFINCTNYDDNTFKNYLVLFLGDDQGKKLDIISEIRELVK